MTDASHSRMAACMCCVPERVLWPKDPPAAGPDSMMGRSSLCSLTEHSPRQCPEMRGIHCPDMLWTGTSYQLQQVGQTRLIQAVGKEQSPRWSHGMCQFCNLSIGNK